MSDKPEGMTRETARHRARWKGRPGGALVPQHAGVAFNADRSAAFVDAVVLVAESEKARPRIVCLCGSTRFSEAFRAANLEETLEGRIVLTVGCDFKSDDALGLGPAAKARLDELHKRKIDLADEILVLNVGGYIGSSTQSEIDYAQTQGKAVRYLEAWEAV